MERIQRAATRWMKGLRGLSYEERLQALKLQPLEKRRLRNDMVLTHKILYNHIDLVLSRGMNFLLRTTGRIYSAATRSICLNGCERCEWPMI